MGSDGRIRSIADSTEAPKEAVELNPQGRAEYWAGKGVTSAADFYVGLIDADPEEKARITAQAHRSAAHRRQEILDVKVGYRSGETSETLLERSQRRSSDTSYLRMVEQILEGGADDRELEAMRNTVVVWTQREELRNALLADEVAAHLEMADYLESLAKPVQPE